MKTRSSVALLWDESFLWGLMAYKALRVNSLPFELVRSDDIRNGRLEECGMLFVPGGWASNKIKSLGDDGVEAIRKFVNEGGNYLGFCGGAGLATMDGIGLLNIRRKPTKERVPSFSGRIHLDTTEHPIWRDLRKGAGSSPVFHAWWPSQFVIGERDIKALASYGSALADSFSSDLNTGDVEISGDWSELEKTYRINLNPQKLLHDPAVVEGTFGKGKVVLSLVHFDTPDDRNGAIVLRNLWDYLAGGSNKSGVTSNGQKNNISEDLSLVTHHSSLPSDSPLVSGLEAAARDLIDLGVRNFLWFWRNPMLLQWRRGVRGLEYCTLYRMVKEIAELSGTTHEPQIDGKLAEIRELLIPFADRAKQLLVLERLALQNGHITYERCDDPEIQKMRAELFSTSKSHGGLFKDLIDQVDRLLYEMLRSRQ